MTSDYGDRSAERQRQEALRRAAAWLVENREWVARYNTDVERYGTFGDNKRLF